MLHLQTVRGRVKNEIPLKRKLAEVMILVFLGSAVGFLAKYFGGTMAVAFLEESFFILTVMIIAVYSRSPIAAVCNTFVYLMSMLLSYYLTFLYLFYFFPEKFFVLWSILAIFVSLGSYLLWYAKGQGWFAAIITAIPISLHLLYGSDIYIPIKYTNQPIFPRLFDFAAALILFVILASKGQRLKVLALIIVFYFVLKEARVISSVYRIIGL